MIGWSPAVWATSRQAQHRPGGRHRSTPEAVPIGGRRGDDPTLATLRADLKAETARDRFWLAELKAEAAEETAPEPPTAEQAAELAKYVSGLSFLNELDQEFADSTPADVRVGECREVLRSFLKGHSIVLNPDPEARAYEATVTMLPLNAMHKSSTAQRVVGPYDIRGCAGRI